MSTTFHELRINTADLSAVHERGETASVVTDRGATVLLYRSGRPLPDTEPGVQLIPVGDFIAWELAETGVSAFTPTGVDTYDSYRIVLDGGPA